MYNKLGQYYCAVYVFTRKLQGYIGTSDARARGVRSCCHIGRSLEGGDTLTIPGLSFRRDYKIGL